MVGPIKSQMAGQRLVPWTLLENQSGQVEADQSVLGHRPAGVPACSLPIGTGRVAMIIAEEIAVMVSRRHNPTLLGPAHDLPESTEFSGAGEITRITHMDDRVALTSTIHEPL